MLVRALVLVRWGRCWPGDSEHCAAWRVEGLTLLLTSCVQLETREAGAGFPCLQATHVQATNDAAGMLLWVLRLMPFGAGVPVVSTDGWPMNELIEHGHNGILVPAAPRGAAAPRGLWIARVY